MTLLCLSLCGILSCLRYLALFFRQLRNLLCENVFVSMADSCALQRIASYLTILWFVDAMVVSLSRSTVLVILLVDSVSRMGANHAIQRWQTAVVFCASAHPSLPPPSAPSLHCSLLTAKTIIPRRKKACHAKGRFQTGDITGTADVHGD